MSKNKQRRRPTILLRGIIMLVFVLIVYMFTAIYLKQYNNQLAVSIQTTERNIAVLSTQKEALKVEIDKLATKTKVVDAINGEEMSHNKENIVYIKNKDE